MSDLLNTYFQQTEELSAGKLPYPRFREAATRLLQNIHKDGMIGIFEELHADPEGRSNFALYQLFRLWRDPDFPSRDEAIANMRRLIGRTYDPFDYLPTDSKSLSFIHDELVDYARMIVTALQKEQDYFGTAPNHYRIKYTPSQFELFLDRMASKRRQLHLQGHDVYPFPQSLADVAMRVGATSHALQIQRVMRPGRWDQSFVKPYFQTLTDKMKLQLRLETYLLLMRNLLCAATAHQVLGILEASLSLRHFLGFQSLEPLSLPQFARPSDPPWNPDEETLKLFRMIFAHRNPFIGSSNDRDIQSRYFAEAEEYWTILEDNVKRGRFIDDTDPAFQGLLKKMIQKGYQPRRF